MHVTWLEKLKENTSFIKWKIRLHVQKEKLFLYNYEFLKEFIIIKDMEKEKEREM